MKRKADTRPNSNVGSSLGSDLVTRLALVFGVVLFSLTGTGSVSAGVIEDVYFEKVDVRSGVTAEIHLRKYQNNHLPCRAGSVLAIHGANSTALSMEPLALALTQRPVDERPVCHVVTIDLPGHGMSEPPDGVAFGELTIDDYANTVIDVLGRLGKDGIRPTTIMGHSMGGMVIQRIQQRLIEQGTSLWDAFHIRHAVLLAPAIPASVHWTFRDDTAGPLMISTFVKDDPLLGSVVDIPPEAFVSVVFTKLDGTLASNAMTPEEIASSGWVSLESWSATGSLFGIGPIVEPDVSFGIFSDRFGTMLDLVAFEQDSVIFASDLGPLFSYLTGKPVGPGFSIVEGEIATHGLPQVDPAFLLGSVDGRVSLP